MKKTLIASVLALACGMACAASAAPGFFVVVPVTGKSPANPIDVTLANYTLPQGVAGVSYAGFDFKSVLQVTGDPAFNSAQTWWSVAAGALPAGLSLNQRTGDLAGTPSAAGTSTFKITAAYKAKMGEQVYSIVVTEAKAAGAWDSTSSDFGAVYAGEQVSRTYTFTSTGSKATTGSYAQLSGGYFSITQNTCGQVSNRISLPSQGACSVTVALTPPGQGLWNSSLSLYDGVTLLAEKSLTGTGLETTGTLSANTTANFGSVNPGSSAELTFNYSIAGNGSATNVVAAVQGADLSITNSTCGTVAAPLGELPAGGTCSVTVKYQPAAVGALANAKLIVSADRDSDALTLQGTGQIGLADNCKRDANGQVWCLGKTAADNGLTTCGYPTGYSGTYYAATAVAAAAHSKTLDAATDCASNYQSSTNTQKIIRSAMTCWDSASRWSRAGAPAGANARVFVRCVNME